MSVPFNWGGSERIFLRDHINDLVQEFVIVVAFNQSLDINRFIKDLNQFVIHVLKTFSVALGCADQNDDIDIILPPQHLLAVENDRHKRMLC